MKYRILHCGKSIQNLKLCIDHKVAGFTRNIATKGDLIYFAIRLEKDKKTMCIARAILGDFTDLKPWKDSKRYTQVFKLEQLDLCEPFDLSILKEIGGNGWVSKFIQYSKEIKDSQAISLLNESFQPTNQLPDYLNLKQLSLFDNEDDFLGNISCDELSEEEKENLSSTNLKTSSVDSLDVMGTFQTICFKNEIDKSYGLEPLVNRYFFQLFKFFTHEKSIMIGDNRLFGTAGIPTISGIKGIPDAVLISYDCDNSKAPFRINIIEYECYGESKVRSSTKFNYMTGTIIPQLIRFASAFSIVTDVKLRETTIEDWIKKIMTFIESDPELINRVQVWLREIDPEIQERQLDLRLKEELKKAFDNNIVILLVIDELTTEQSETIKNIIQSFKLKNGNSIEFNSYVIRLEQQLNVVDANAQYALSIQE